MKKAALVIMILFMWVGVAGAVVTTAPGDVITQISNPTAIAGAAAGASASVRDTNTVSPKITTKVDTKTTVNPVINAGQTIAPTQSLQVTAPRDPIEVPMSAVPDAKILSGKVFRYDLLPRFANKALQQYKGEPVFKVLYQSYGNIFSRITPDELPQFLIKKADKFKGMDNARTDVVCKDASHGLSVGLGGVYSTTSRDGNISSGGTLGASGVWAVSDAYCFVYIYEVEVK